MREYTAPAPPAASLPNWLILKLGVPIALTCLAGRRYFPLWAVLQHQGRASGRALRVPVAVQVRGDEVVIPLLFGPRTNWVQNVLAAGGCVIRWRGAEHGLNAPELIGPEQAEGYFGRFGWSASQRLVAPRGFLHLRVAQSPVGAQNPEGVTAMRRITPTRLPSVTRPRWTRGLRYLLLAVLSAVLVTAGTMLASVHFRKATGMCRTSDGACATLDSLDAA